MEYWQRLRQAVGHDTLVLPAAAGAVVKDGQILLVRSTSVKKWQIPGGLLEPGEAIQATVSRELEEELGLVLAARELVSVYSGAEWLTEYPNGDKVQQLLFFFKMAGDVDEIRLQKSELSDYRFVGPDEVPENTMPCCKQKVIDYFAYQGHTFFR